MSFHQHQLSVQSHIKPFPSQLEKLGASDARKPVMQNISSCRAAEMDDTWHRLRYEAGTLVLEEPILSNLARVAILDQTSIAGSIAYTLSRSLAGAEVSEETLRWTILSAFDSDRALAGRVLEDIVAVYNCDPACRKLLQPILFFKGFQALQGFRIAHYYWNNNRRDLAAYIQTRVAEVFAIDIHPAAKIGRSVVLDHGHSIVVGETAVIGDNVTILHSVTLGGTGKENKDRHPKIGNNVTIGAGASVLGNIKIGDGAKIAAGSVVLRNVLTEETVAGVPAKPIKGEQAKKVVAI